MGSPNLLEDSAEMNDYEASTYGEGVADVYDGWYSSGDVAPIVGRLAELAGDGPVLELEHRWGGWNEVPFTASSGNHVTVYRKPG